MEIFHDLSLYLFKESKTESRYQHQKLSIRVVSRASVWFKTYGPWTWEFISKRSYSQNSFFIPLKLFHDKQKQPPELFLENGVLKICSKFTGEHPCRSMISIKLICNFIEITLRPARSPVNFLHIFRAPIINILKLRSVTID